MTKEFLRQRSAWLSAERDDDVMVDLTPAVSGVLRARLPGMAAGRSCTVQEDLAAYAPVFSRPATALAASASS